MNIEEETLRKLIREVVLATIEELSNPFHIILLFDKNEKESVELSVLEQWYPSKIKDYWLRVEKSKFDTKQLCVHIARQKHIDTKSEKIAWKKDTTMHNKQSFNTNLAVHETAMKIARDALRLMPSKELENINDAEGKLLLETIEYLPESSSIFIFKVVKKVEPKLRRAFVNLKNHKTNLLI